MFERQPENNEVMFRGEKINEVSDEKLLEIYSLVQNETSSKINTREMIEHAKDENPFPVTAEEMQDKTEEHFAYLNAVKTEIEKRGLEAPTMEERGI